jgi:hypothetical protein
MTGRRASELRKTADDLGLVGEGKRLFEQWRSLGYSWLEALEQVRRAGLAPATERQAVTRSGRPGVPIQESGGSWTDLVRARQEARHGESQDQLAGMFESAFGLSEAEARVAARGHEEPVQDERAVYRALGLSEAEVDSAIRGRGGRPASSPSREIPADNPLRAMRDHLAWLDETQERLDALEERQRQVDGR